MLIINSAKYNKENSSKKKRKKANKDKVTGECNVQSNTEQMHGQSQGQRLEVEQCQEISDDKTYSECETSEEQVALSFEMVATLLIKNWSHWNYFCHFSVIIVPFILPWIMYKTNPKCFG